MINHKCRDCPTIIHETNPNGSWLCKPCSKVDKARYRARYVEKAKAQKIAWLKAHPNWEKEYAPRRRLLQLQRDINNPEMVAARQKRYVESHKDKTREDIRRHQKQYRIAGTLSDDKKKEIIARYDGCAICGLKVKLGVDHITPVSKGGKSTDDNLQALCPSCNSSKGDRILDEVSKAAIKKLSLLRHQVKTGKKEVYIIDDSEVLAFLDVE